MKKTLQVSIVLPAAFAFGFYVNMLVTDRGRDNERSPVKKETAGVPQMRKEKEAHLRLGAFSVSLSVKDLQASKAFYETLGFTQFAGDVKQNYLIMKNGNALIGLFQGMFEGNLLTFNPGWDENAQNVEDFDDIRVIQQRLKAGSIKLDSEADEKTTGPASLMTKDPDGNVVLIDQHR